MKKLCVLLVLVGALGFFTLTRGGHELPIYPSYYPQEIQIESVDPASAGRLLEQTKIHAYVGDEAVFEHATAKSISQVESLGAYIVLTLNSASPLLANAAACSVTDAIAHTVAVARERQFFFHPYPVTPFHGDYLHHFDLVEAAKKRLASAPVESAALRGLKLKTKGALAQHLLDAPRQPQTPEWDVTVEQIDVDDLIAPYSIDLNGWLGPPALKQGWFHAYLLLAAMLSDSSARRRAESYFQRLRTGDYSNPTERLNLERDLLTVLSGQCRRVVIGYTLKREYFNSEYSAGIENIAYDSQAGLNSAIFIRTVKLKDLPWNGWLRLGIKQKPAAAWNPLGGFSDDAGRLIWFALGDPALFPEPYNANWLLNRMGDVQSTPAR